MDPEANLREQLELAASINERTDNEDEATGDLQPEDVSEQCDDAQRLAELVESLDGWIRSSGFLPPPWGENHPTLVRKERLFIVEALEGVARLQDTLWPNGDAGHEWTSSTIEDVASGFKPATSKERELLDELIARLR